jgi:hypothetical protein
MARFDPGEPKDVLRDQLASVVFTLGVIVTELLKWGYGQVTGASLSLLAESLSTVMELTFGLALIDKLYREARRSRLIRDAFHQTKTVFGGRSAKAVIAGREAGESRHTGIQSSLAQNAPSKETHL